jgi:sulfide:quinone oxidoreductase
MTASRMLKLDKSLDIAIIEPSDTHYYQAAWTLVGAGTYDYDKTGKPMKDLIPKGAEWIKDAASGFKPEDNTVQLASGGEVQYEYLVVAPGLVYDYSLVPGLGEAINKGVVCSNYTDPKHTWKVLQDFKGGTALFTQPATPIKCGGAPQKIMYLAESHFRRSGVREKTNVVFATPGTTIFGVPEIKKTLLEVVDRKDINLRFGHKLVKVDAEKQIAWYAFADHEHEYNHKDIQIEKDGDLTGIHYDMMHTAPPSAAPRCIQDSPLANEAKWLDIDKHSMQHNRFPNVFGLGDVAGIPAAKTGAAIRKQVPVLIDNLFGLIRADAIGDTAYNGYSSCPLVTDYGKMVLAEFDYDNNFTPDPKLKQMLISDSSKEHWRLWILKKYGLPYLYWNKMMKGKEV